MAAKCLQHEFTLPILRNEPNEIQFETGRDTPLHSKWALGVIPNGGNLVHVYCKCVEKFAKTEIKNDFEFKIDAFTESKVLYTCNDKVDTIKQSEVNCFRKFDELTVGNTIWSDCLTVAKFSGPNRIVYDEMAFLVAHLTISIAKEKLPQSLLSSVEAANINLASLVANDSARLDTKIICSDGKEFRCHSNILKANSPVFETMLKPGFNESKTGIINIKDISGKTMDVLIHYMYSGRLQDSWKGSDVIIELLNAAGKYEIKLLLEFLDNELGNIKEIGYESGGTLMELKSLAGKLGLKKAENQLQERVVSLIGCAGNTEEIMSLFGDE